MIRPIPTYSLPIALMLVVANVPLAVAQPTGKAVSEPPDCREVLTPTFDEVFGIARGWGSADKTTSESGKPMISGRIEGVKYALMFYNCDDAQQICTSAQFVSGFTDTKADLQRLNEWNAGRRFGKAWLDDDNDAVLEFNFTLTGGLTRENLDDIFDWWRVIGNSYRQFLYED